MQDRDKEVSGQESNQRREPPESDPMRLVREVVEDLLAEQKKENLKQENAARSR
jgi:hypothetical protein